MFDLTIKHTFLLQALYLQYVFEQYFIYTENLIIVISP